MPKENEETNTNVETGDSNPGVIITKTDEQPKVDTGEALPSPSPFDKILNKLSSGKSAKDAISELKEETKVSALKSLNDTLGDQVQKTEDKPKEEEEEPKGEKEESIETSEVKTEDVKTDEKETATEEEVPASELQVLPHDKPKTARRIQGLLKKIDEVSTKEATTAKQLQEKESKLAELEKKLGEVQSVDPATNEAIKKQLDELSMYKRRYDLEKDPEFQSRFDNRITGAEKSIEDIFAAKTGGDQLNKIVKEEGGWIKFSESAKLYKMNDGSTMSGAELAEDIRSKLPASERRAIDAAELEQAQARRERQRFIEEESKKASEYFKQQEAQAAKAREDQSKAAETVKKQINDWETKFVSDNAFFTEEKVDGLTGEKLEAANDKNRHAKQLRDVLKKNMAANDLDSMLTVISESVKYHEERRQHAIAIAKIKSLEDQLKARQAEIDTFKKASATTPRSGTIQGGGKGQVRTQDTPVDIIKAFEAKAKERGLF